MTEVVKILKLSTNEDIICELDEETQYTFIAKNLVQIYMVPGNSSDKEIKFAFAPYPSFTKLKSEIPVHFLKSQIVLITDPDPDFLDQYKQIFSKVIAPTSKIII